MIWIISKDMHEYSSPRTTTRINAIISKLKGKNLQQRRLTLIKRSKQRKHNSTWDDNFVVKEDALDIQL